MQLGLTWRMAEFKQIQDLHLWAPKSCVLRLGTGTNLLPAGTSPCSAPSGMRELRLGLQGRSFYPGLRDQPAHAECSGRCHRVPRDRADSSEQPLEHRAGREVIPGAALLSALSLPHKRLKEQCNYVVNQQHFVMKI